jgi:PAS domain S-box-containing protein
MKISKNAMIRSYAQSMGIEAAKDLITKKIKSAALEEKEHYTEEETAKICGELITEGGLIRIVAQNFVVQLERKRSEEQALLLDNIENQIWYLRDVETYGAVNKAHAEFLGMEKEKLEGRDLYDIISVEEADVCITNNREVFEKKKQSHTEEWVKNGRGETRLLSITRTPKLDGKGDVEYVICAAEDITERKQAGERIEHLNNVLKAIMTVNQLIVVEKDRDSLLQKVCDALVEARGYDAVWLGLLSDGETFATVKGSGFREDFSRFREHLIGGEHLPCFKNALAQKDPFMLVDKSIQCGDCFFKNAHINKEVAIIRVEHANRLFGLLAISLASDVADDEEEKGILREVAGDIGFALHDMEVEEERKQAEEERERLLKELEAKTAEMARFTYTISHDLKSPLITVQGFVEMLREDLERNEKEKVESDLKFIENGTTKMEHLLNDTLRLSRIGRVANPPEDVPFGEIVQEALQQTAHQIKLSGIEITVAEDFPAVHVDQMRIVEVLVNLVTNSIKYMGEQPRPKIDIGYRVDEEETVFCVRDNGIGIDPSQHEKVFELFYQIKKNNKGTGAGLAIVKRIIEVHRSRILIESEKGKGCTVCFTLPLSQVG